MDIEKLEAEIKAEESSIENFTGRLERANIFLQLAREAEQGKIEAVQVPEKHATSLVADAEWRVEFYQTEIERLQSRLITLGLRLNYERQLQQHDKRDEVVA